MGEREEMDVADYQKLRYIASCLCESLRLYPHPPVLIRRALLEHELPGGIKVRDNRCTLLRSADIES